MKMFYLSGDSKILVWPNFDSKSTLSLAGTAHETWWWIYICVGLYRCKCLAEGEHVKTVGVVTVAFE
jgi:hypothetical protein